MKTTKKTDKIKKIKMKIIETKTKTTLIIIKKITCWSTPTASSPWCIIFTQPSFDANTNKAISACGLIYYCFYYVYYCFF